MKKLAILFLALALALTPVLSACNDGQSPADADTETSDTATETPAEAETQPEETRVFENSDTAPSETVTGSATLSKPYAERITETSGSGKLIKAGVTMKYNTLFYGHDSAIDRDRAEYGTVYKSAILSNDLYKGDYVVGDFTGDLYGDMAVYADGVLSIYPTVVDTKKTFTYNNKTYPSVYGNEKSRYTFAAPITFTLGLGDATLRGTGDFDGNGYCDLLLVTADGTVILGLSSEQGITPTEAGLFRASADRLHCGDVDADGLCDLIMIDGYTVTTFYNTAEGFAAAEPTTLPFDIPYTVIAVGDINSDRRADVIWLENVKFPCYRTMFGRGDGFFGPRPEEMGEAQGNTNLYAVSGRARSPEASHISVGDMSGDGVGDLLLYAATGAGKGFTISIDVGDAPYDYSLFGMACEDGTYKMFAGGRWHDRSEAVKDSLMRPGEGDGDHVMIYSSNDGLTWDRYIDGPAFYLGIEQGQGGWEELGDGWWTGNTLEPEVVYVDGVYHMILQSSGYTQSGYYGDYLGYASSTDGIHFTRKTDSPIILPEPGKDFTQFKEVCRYEIGFNHHEMIYVPDDPDGKVFHLYTGHFKNNQFAGYVRLRSADPTCFYWNEREVVDGFAQIGNQVGYVSNYDGEGHRLFLRITFTDYTDGDGTRTVPTLQYSVDGLKFYGTGIYLASVDVTDPVTEYNHNVYFLGFCTVNGTGEIERNEDGSYKLVYLATTSATPVAPEIFGSEAGVGVLNFTLE